MGKARERTAGAAGARSLRGFILRFLLGFALLEALIYFLLWRDAWFAPYAAWNARLSAALLSPWVEGVQGLAGYLLAPGFTINIRPGCDAYQSSAVLLAGIGAFPASRRRKLIGAAVGVLVLLVLNVVRLALILVTGLQKKELFDTMHLEVMPALLFFAALVLWLGWTLWVRPAQVS